MKTSKSSKSSKVEQVEQVASGPMTLRRAVAKPPPRFDASGTFLRHDDRLAGC